MATWTSPAAHGLEQGVAVGPVELDQGLAFDQLFPDILHELLISLSIAVHGKGVVSHGKGHADEGRPFQPVADPALVGGR